MQGRDLREGEKQAMQVEETLLTVAKCTHSAVLLYAGPPTEKLLDLHAFDDS